MGIDEAYRKVLLKLADRTTYGLVDWEPTSDEDIFVAHLGKYSVSIRRWWDQRDSTWNVTFDILDPAGERMDRFVTTSGVDDDFQWASEMWSYARQKALKIDEAVREMLDALDKLGPNQPEKTADDDVPF